MFDCCLISLPKPYLRQPDAQAPMGILYVASALESAGYSVAIHIAEDFNASAIPDARLYGISATSMEINQAVLMSITISHRKNFAPIVLGGPGVFALDPKIKKNGLPFTSISFGDGEQTIIEIMRDMDAGKTLRPEYRGFISDINTIRPPARHLIANQGGNIFAYNKKWAQGDSTIILSSRGCAHNCAFCSAPKITDSSLIRFRDPDAVAAEIRYVKSTFGIRQFRFSDDMFTASKQRTLAMCEAIGKEDVFWRISCRVHPLDDDMLKAMLDAGCRELSFGIESFDQDVLSGLRKGTTTRMNVNALVKAKEHGFTTRVLMMVATPFQTPKTMSINKNFLTILPYDIVACTAFLPIPGCDIWDHPERYGVRIIDRSMDNYNFYAYGPAGRRPIPRVISIAGRDDDEFIKESEDFRDFLEATGKLNKG